MSGSREGLTELKGVKGRLLGLDYGTKTIGIALSDLTRTVATPHTTLSRTKFKVDSEALKAIITEFDISGLIVGLPLNMDGSEGPRCQSTRQFVRNLEDTLTIPIVFWDERLSTVAVTRTLIEADTSRAKRAEVVDKVAASYILQGALDSLRRIESIET